MAGFGSVLGLYAGGFDNFSGIFFFYSVFDMSEPFSIVNLYNCSRK